MFKDMWNDSGMRILIILFSTWVLLWITNMVVHFTIIPWHNKRRTREGKPLTAGVLGRRRR